MLIILPVRIVYNIGNLQLLINKTSLNGHICRLKCNLNLPRNKLILNQAFYFIGYKYPLNNTFLTMSLSNTFVGNSPTIQSRISNKRTHRHTINHYQYYNNQYRKRNASLIDIYSIEANQIKSKEINRSKSSTRQKIKELSFHLTYKPNNKKAIVQNGNSYCVNKAIDSVNKYAQQLRVTLLQQYKSHKAKSLRGKKAKELEQPLIVTSIQADDYIRQDNKAKDKSISKEDKNAPFSTLNLLYQAIIDNTFRKRKKQQFQLQAVKLPMVDRFNTRNQMIKLQRQMSFKTRMQDLKKHDSNSSQSKFGNKVNYLKSKSKLKERLQQQQDNRINAWAVEQNFFE